MINFLHDSSYLNIPQPLRSWFSIDLDSKQWYHSEYYICAVIVENLKAPRHCVWMYVIASYTPYPSLPSFGNNFTVWHNPYHRFNDGELSFRPYNISYHIYIERDCPSLTIGKESWKKMIYRWYQGGHHKAFGHWDFQMVIDSLIDNIYISYVCSILQKGGLEIERQPTWKNIQLSLDFRYSIIDHWFHSLHTFMYR